MRCLWRVTLPLSVCFMKQLNNVVMSFRLGNPQWCAKLRMKRVNFHAWNDMFKTNHWNIEQKHPFMSAYCRLTSSLWFSSPALVMTTRTARRTMVTTFKGCKVQPWFHFSPALREWESVGIWLRPLGNAAYVACLPLLCQGSKWLNGKSFWLVWIPAGFLIFFCSIHECLLSFPINNVKPLKPLNVNQMCRKWLKGLPQQVTDSLCAAK